MISAETQYLLHYCYEYAHDQKSVKTQKTRYSKKSAGITTTVVAGSAFATVGTETVRAEDCPPEAVECDGSSYKQIRHDGYKREVQLSQSIEMIYYGSSETPSGDGYTHEFAVEGLGSTRFSYDDEEFHRSYQAELAEAEFTVSSREGHNIDEIKSYGSGVPDDEAYTVDDIVIDGAKIASSLLLKRSPKRVRQTWKAIQVAATLVDTSGQVSDGSSTISEQWTMNWFQDVFGYSGGAMTDMTQYVRFFVYLPKAGGEWWETTSDTLDIDMSVHDDKGREHGTEMSYEIMNPTEDPN